MLCCIISIFPACRLPPLHPPLHPPLRPLPISACLSAGGFPTTGSTVRGRAAAWASRSGRCAACSSSTTAPTARCTASTAAARSPRADEPATECRAPPPGGRGRGQRFVPTLVNYLATANAFLKCQLLLFSKVSSRLSAVDQ